MRGGVADRYIYIVARLRAIEATLPEPAWFERLARVPEEGLLGSLREYVRGFETVGSPFEFERALEAERLAVLELVTGLLPGERERLFIRAGYDFDNLRHAFKAAKLGREAALTPFGLVSPEAAAEAAAGRARGSLPAHLEEHLALLEAAYGDGRSLAAAEYAGEGAKWRFLAACAPDEPSADYLRARIDLENLKTMLRLARVPLRAEPTEAAWIEGGEIETATLRRLAREPLDELFAHLATTSYRRLPQLGFAKDMPGWLVDPVLRRALMERLGESRYRSFDFSPVLYHLELRARDEEILRRVIAGKLNRMDEGALLERVESLLAA